MNNINENPDKDDIVTEMEGKMDSDSLEGANDSLWNSSVETDSFFGISCDDKTNSTEISEGNNNYTFLIG